MRLESRPVTITCFLAVAAAMALTAPAVVADPAVTDPGLFALEVYAHVVDPFHISFDAAGNLYVGRSDNAAPLRIRKVAPGGMSVAEFGDPIWDPDGVLVDRNGNLGPAGSVLVAGASAGGASGFPARIARITPGGATSTLAVVDPVGPELNNPQQMAFTPAGRLLIANFGTTGANTFGTVSTVNAAGEASVVVDVGRALGGIAISPAGRVFVALTLSGAVHEIVGGGSVPVAEGLSVPDALAHAPIESTLLDMPLFSVERGNGNITRINTSTGETEVFATGFDGPFGLDFGPDFCLYVSEFGEDRIWRIGLNDGDGGVICPGELGGP